DMVTPELKNDSLSLVKKTMNKIVSNQIDFTTFSAKVNVDYKGVDGKNYNVNANIRMYKDSVIWISAIAVLGIEAMRVMITKDSVKVIDKLSKTYTVRSVSYLQEVTSLPLDLKTLQNLILGNPVFFDPNIVSYSTSNNVISLLSIGKWFKNLLTINASDMALLHSKLDDADRMRNRTADLTYRNYENKKGFLFSTRRRIVVAEKKTLDIKLDFRQYNFNVEVGFPFGIPKNFDRN
ncbi:MAG TPA: DUF4292 domain-containing protein, partial [Flavisolibacter sp.]|nr:DUF4292 domain-containing protein [Flavisolibacter sp.]